MTICIAGKNDIPVEILSFLLQNYPEHNYIGCPNQNDFGHDSFQRSFRKFCILKGVKICSLKEVYEYNDICFLSLEFDKIVNPDKFKSNRLFNIHFSLLPAYKGVYTSAMPILNNEKYSGVTLHKIDVGIDTGDIIAQTQFLIGNNTTAQELYAICTLHGISLIKEHLDNLINDIPIGKPQIAKNSSYYSTSSIDYSNVVIDLKKTAQEIHNQIRAFCFPAYQLPKIKEYPVYRSEIIEKKAVGKAGEIIFEDEFSIQISTIDFQLKAFKNRLDELIEISRSGLVERFNHFLNSGYDVKQRTKQGWDALIVAAFNGQLTFTKFLIESLGWDVNVKNNNGTTFAMYVMTNASQTGDYKLLKYLLSLENVDWGIPDHSGKDIFEYADIYNNQKVIELISIKKQ